MKYPIQYISLLAVLLLFFCSLVSGESVAKIDLSMDALEHQLEMSRHEQLIAQKNKQESQLYGFTTDGCSGGLSVGWEFLSENIPKFQNVHGDKPPWESCCVSHDRSYHVGGKRGISGEESFKLRKQADQTLRTCVQESGTGRINELSDEYNIPPAEVERLYSIIAGLMYHAVRIGGIPCTTLPWRWGYGWPECD